MFEINRGDSEDLALELRISSTHNLNFNNPVVFQESVGDDLEKFMAKLKEESFQKLTDFVSVTFCTPMLTEQELELLNQKNKDFIRSFAWHYYLKAFNIDESEFREEYFFINYYFE